MFAGESAFFLNGRAMDMEIYDVFTLLDIMLAEAKLVEGLHTLGFKVRTVTCASPPLLSEHIHIYTPT